MTTYLVCPSLPVNNRSYAIAGHLLLSPPLNPGLHLHRNQFFPSPIETDQFIPPTDLNDCSSLQQISWTVHPSNLNSEIHIRHQDISTSAAFRASIALWAASLTAIFLGESDRWKEYLKKTTAMKLMRLQIDSGNPVGLIGSLSSNPQLPPSLPSTGMFKTHFTKSPSTEENGAIDCSWCQFLKFG
ncbi:hypothetical protein LXL04_031633 [Taraxacum kok-saghyz]